jgi:hypothetical protein
MNKSELENITGLTAAVARATGQLWWGSVAQLVLDLREASEGIGRLNTQAYERELTQEEAKELDAHHVTVLRVLREIPGARAEVAQHCGARAVCLNLPDGSGYAVGGGWWV